jgi:tetratricopeptide (TPR) repeat protein
MFADLPAAAEHLRPGLAAWLLRPFLDLGPLMTGPLYARGIAEYWRAFVKEKSAPFALQRTLPPAFRDQLISEAGRPEYGVNDPRQLPEHLHTDRWREMCDALDDWKDLGGERRCRLVVLLHSLCIYQPVLSLVPLAVPRAGWTRIDEVNLAYWRASAQYVLGVPNQVSDYVYADLSAFEAIVEKAPDAVPAAFNAALKVFVHKAKVGAPLDELRAWSVRAERALAHATSKLDGFAGELLISRYYRAIGFLPQRHGDRASVVELMDLAERHALALKPATDAQRLLYLENLHPLMESRTKEAVWLGDQDLALARAIKVVDLDPCDSKAWVELGEVRMARKEWSRAAEAYVVAGMLGPPASAVGRHMAGVCFRELGQDLLAAFFFKDALEVDPLGISPHDEIRALPDAAVLKALKAWSRNTIEL